MQAAGNSTCLFPSRGPTARTHACPEHMLAGALVLSAGLSGMNPMGPAAAGMMGLPGMSGGFAARLCRVVAMGLLEYCSTAMQHCCSRMCCCRCAGVCACCLCACVLVRAAVDVLLYMLPCWCACWLSCRLWCCHDGPDARHAGHAYCYAGHGCCHEPHGSAAKHTARWGRAVFERRRGSAHSTPIGWQGRCDVEMRDSHVPGLLCLTVARLVLC